jgi:hypothetical protein
MTKHVTNFAGTLGMVLVLLAVMPSATTFAKGGGDNCSESTGNERRCAGTCANGNACAGDKPSSGKCSDKCD